jgi:DNA-binding transcriptional ArsR family regulator
MREPLKVVSEPRRQEILQLIWDRERSAGDIAAQVPVSFSAVSQHLARLREAGLVDVRVEGRNRYYRARKHTMGTLAIYLESMWTDKLAELKRLAETEERSFG